MSLFRQVFTAVFVGSALTVAAVAINKMRPAVESKRDTAALIKANGKCAECHRDTHASIVHEYELSAHARNNVNCLDCHQPAAGQAGTYHRGFMIMTKLTAANCRSCHGQIYEQFVRSRHAAPAWAAVHGSKDFSGKQIEAAEAAQPGSVKRPPHPLVALEGAAATNAGCSSCHAIGRPNADGSIGTCTACHARHVSSVELARLPTTCGQCHMGPDHSQLEIYTESKHGVLFEAQKGQMNLAASPQKLTTQDMFVPTCATCHMSGLNGAKTTHDPAERLSYFLYAEVSRKRPQFETAQDTMKQICRNCHSRSNVDRVFQSAEDVVATTNTKVKAAKQMIDELRTEGLIGSKPFQTPIDFMYFDLWHYDARTTKHGAFMGGGDFVQWHGSYPMLKHTVELQHAAQELRRTHGRKTP